MTNKALLIILDGWGIGEIPESDAIAQANTPYIDQLIEDYPNNTLTTFGEKVGLPKGQMGNSEVGHLNIGAGRIVFQELARINNAVKDKSFGKNEVLLEAIEYAKINNCKFHCLGLISDGGVHSHTNHLNALIDILDDHGLEKVFIHGFLDGRDTAPTGGKKYIADLVKHCKHKSAKLATIIGRYYAMDRDMRWDRIKKAYELLVHGIGESTSDPVQSINGYYEKEITDEFMEPLLCNSDGKVEAGDVVLFINFRTDRPRQLTTALTQKAFPNYEMSPLELHFVSMTEYDASYKNINVLFTKDNIKNTIGEVLADAGKTQIRIAETEKYPHVTFFFNGGREKPFVGEDRIMIPSPKVATYDLKPEMSANEITDAITEAIATKTPDFICLNYANTDMVGHTGDFKAAMVAAETVDQCVKRLVKTATDHEYHIFIIADHGNSDYMINEDRSPHTAHTTNPVPIIYISEKAKTSKILEGKLADLAPTILSVMHVAKPEEMTGNVLIS